MKNKGTAILLTIFLGGLGAHKFYLGKPIQGLFYLVFCWTFVPVLLSWIDLVIYICTREHDWNIKYNNFFIKVTDERGKEI